MTIRRRRILRRPGLAAALAVLSVAGCSAHPGSSSGAADPSGNSLTGTVIAVTLTDSGCNASSLTAPAGKVSFDVTGSGSGAVSELEVQRSGRILAERENIVAGISGDFSVSLVPGSYTLYCPGGSGPDSHTFTATSATSATSAATAASASTPTAGAS